MPYYKNNCWSNKICLQPPIVFLWEKLRWLLYPETETSMVKRVTVNLWLYQSQTGSRVFLIVLDLINQTSAIILQHLDQRLKWEEHKLKGTIKVIVSGSKICSVSRVSKASKKSKWSDYLSLRKNARRLTGCPMDTWLTWASFISTTKQARQKMSMSCISSKFLLSIVVLGN